MGCFELHWHGMRSSGELNFNFYLKKYINCHCAESVAEREGVEQVTDGYSSSVE